MLAIRLERDEKIVIRDLNTNELIITIHNDLIKHPNRGRPQLAFSASKRFNISREKIT